MKTKEKILDVALELFSCQGYQETSVAEIAEAVGIKAPSLYKHYRSKQAIFEAIVEKMKQQYRQQASELQINGTIPELAAGRYKNITEEDFVHTVLLMFRFFLQDSCMARFRKMMVLEQYRNPGMAQLYRQQYFEGPVSYQTELFRKLSEAGVLKDADPETMALQFYGPVFTLLNLCDHAPEQIPRAERMLREHVLAFSRLYGRGKTL